MFVLTIIGDASTLSSNITVFNSLHILNLSNLIKESEDEEDGVDRRKKDEVDGAEGDDDEEEDDDREEDTGGKEGDEKSVGGWNFYSSLTFLKKNF